jgi:hypothetical protein
LSDDGRRSRSPVAVVPELVVRGAGAPSWRRARGFGPGAPFPTGPDNDSESLPSASDRHGLPGLGGTGACNESDGPSRRWRAQQTFNRCTRETRSTACGDHPHRPGVVLGQTFGGDAIREWHADADRQRRRLVVPALPALDDPRSVGAMDNSGLVLAAHDRPPAAPATPPRRAGHYL